MDTALALEIDAPRRPATVAPDTPRLVVDRVCARFGAVTALDHVSLAVREGEVLCLLGPSGSGKSTLLRLIAGIDRPASGRLDFDGAEMSGARRFVEPEGRRVGMVFQDYALFPHLTVAANIAFGLRRLPRVQQEETVRTWLDRLSLSRHAGSYPHMLSGGERQRVALARALAPAPRVLLMDEPFSSLDGRLRDRVRDETVALLRETATTTVLVTHDPDEAMHIADRIALLREGRLVQCGTPEDLYLRPATAFAARFFGEVNELQGTCRGRHVETPIGRFAAPHLEEGRTATVCVRPQHLRLARHPTPIAARVLRATFLGEIDQLQVAAAGLASPLTLRVLGRTGVEAGAAVHLDIEPDAVIVVPTDESPQPGGSAAHGAPR